MNTPAVFYFLVVVLMSQSINAQTPQYNLTDYQTHLDLWEANWVRLARGNPIPALQQQDRDLQRAMEIAYPLTNRTNPPADDRPLQPDQAADDMVDLLKRNFQAFMNNHTEIHDYAQSLCANLQYPYTNSIRTNPLNDRFIKRIDMRILDDFCTPLGLDSRYARCSERRFERQLNVSVSCRDCYRPQRSCGKGTRDRFVATANQSPVLNLTVFWADLNKAFNISDLLFHKGIREPGETTVNMMRALRTMLADSINVPYVRTWAQGICEDEAIPYPELITSDPDNDRFERQLNDRVPRLCELLSRDCPSCTLR